MSQLILELFPEESPSFENYIAGNNEEAVTALKAFISAGNEQDKNHHHEGLPTSFYLWGAEGVGKTHLLRAARALALSRGVRVFDLGDTIDDASLAGSWWVIDDADQLDEEGAARLFTLYNALRLPKEKGAMIVAGNAPPAKLTLREDARSRLQWGLIYEITRLSDEDKARALIAFAQKKGLPFPDEVLSYLMRTLPRDMRTLISVMNALDDRARAEKRAITLPFAQKCLAENIE